MREFSPLDLKRPPIHSAVVADFSSRRADKRLLLGTGWFLLTARGNFALGSQYRSRRDIATGALRHDAGIEERRARSHRSGGRVCAPWFERPRPPPSVR